jgi:hypothetical protein
VATRVHINGATEVELWLAGAWPLDPPIVGSVLNIADVFGNGAMVLHEHEPPTATFLLGPDGATLQAWPEIRTFRSLDDRMVSSWGKASPELIPGGLALLRADGSSTELIVEPGVAPKAVNTAPTVRAISALMTDGSNSTLHYGRPSE